MTVRPYTIAAIASVFVFFILLSLAQELNRQWQVEREVQRLEREVKQMQATTVELQNLNQYFQTDDFQERLAREKLNFRAPGEQVVLIPEQELRSEKDTSPVDEESADLSIPRKWWEAFFSERGYL
ncbi:MAG: septum formation initiator family protein [Candidatus Andersenbacteria bacterium]|nr:septum formation initiator family protein [Candidatus Andersenbacteria bacterium]MBI3250387.1 septum formation initiator family protein [Candidatus Andersenbacteria bacterium]